MALAAFSDKPPFRLDGRQYQCEASMDSLLFASAFVPSTTRNAPNAFLKHQIVHRQPPFLKGVNLFVSLDFTPHEHKLIRDNNMGSVVIVERNLDYEKNRLSLDLLARRTTAQLLFLSDRIEPVTEQQQPK
jgi:hypothetical protein